MANSPMVIPVILRVTGVALAPVQTIVMVYPCDRDPLSPMETITRTVAVVGHQIPSTETFTVSPGQAAWLTVNPRITTVPSTLELVVDPNLAADSDQASIVISASDDPSLQFTGSLRFICTDNAVFAPVITRN